MRKTAVLVVVLIAMPAFAAQAAFAIGMGVGGGGSAPPAGGKVVGIGGGSFAPGQPSGIPWAPPGAPEPKPAPGPSQPGTPGAAPPSPSGADPGRSPAPSPSGSPSGQPGPSGPGQGKPDSGRDGEPQLSVKPTILFFARYAVEMKPGVWSSDDEVKATMRYFNEVFREKEVVELAREFICTVADVRKLDSYGNHLPVRTDKAPTVVLLDIDRKPLFQTSDPGLQWKTFADALRKALKKADDQVKALAKRADDNPRVRQARDRVVHIESREEYNKAMASALAGKWAQAEKGFRALTDSKTGNEFKTRAKNGLLEIDAGKIVEEALTAIRARRIEQARNLLNMAVALKEAEHYSKIAAEILKSL